METAENECESFWNNPESRSDPSGAADVNRHCVNRHGKWFLSGLSVSALLTDSFSVIVL